MEDFKWEIKVTSKGQITLPKQARDVMMVREGDYLEATVRDDTLLLTKKAPLDDSEQIREVAAHLLRQLGFVDGGRPLPDRRNLRESLKGTFPDLTHLVREGREGR